MMKKYALVIFVHYKNKIVQSHFYNTMCVDGICFKVCLFFIIYNKFFILSAQRHDFTTLIISLLYESISIVHLAWFYDELFPIFTVIFLQA